MGKVLKEGVEDLSLLGVASRGVDLLQGYLDILLEVVDVFLFQIEIIDKLTVLPLEYEVLLCKVRAVHLIQELLVVILVQAQLINGLLHLVHLHNDAFYLQVPLLHQLLENIILPIFVGSSTKHILYCNVFLLYNAFQDVVLLLSLQVLILAVNQGPFQLFDLSLEVPNLLSFVNLLFAHNIFFYFLYFFKTSVHFLLIVPGIILPNLLELLVKLWLRWPFWQDGCREHLGFLRVGRCHNYFRNFRNCNLFFGVLLAGRCSIRRHVMQSLGCHGFGEVEGVAALVIKGLRQVQRHFSFHHFRRILRARKPFIPGKLQIFILHYRAVFDVHNFLIYSKII